MAYRTINNLASTKSFPVYSKSHLIILRLLKEGQPPESEHYFVENCQTSVILSTCGGIPELGVLQVASFIASTVTILKVIWVPQS